MCRPARAENTVLNTVQTVVWRCAGIYTLRYSIGEERRNSI
jgi:hypothetical protein